MRRLIRGLFKLGLLAGLGYVAYRLIAQQAPAGDEPFTAAPSRTPPAEPVRTGARPGAGTKPAGATRPASAPSQPTPAPKPGGVRSIGVGEVADTVLKWVEPNDDGSCPPTHPVKAKLESGIFHVPGGRHYERVTPDRCYRDADGAVADGLRPSKQ